MSSELKERLAAATGHHVRGDIVAAVALYREILNQSPREPDALFMLGVIAMQQGNPTAALSFVEAALASNPDFASAWFNRSIILRVLGRDPDALSSARHAVQCDPTLAQAWDMIAQLLCAEGSVPEALVCHGRAIELQPQSAHFQGNYALSLFVVGDLFAAYRAALGATQLDPSYPPMLLGNILRAMGYPEQAATAFARTYALRPDFVEAAASEAMARLQMGDWENGWRLWEKRPDFAAAILPIPLWQGQRVARLFLYEDQGLGDALQFMRYLPLVKSRADSVVLRVSATLTDLCAQNFPDIEILSENASMPVADVRCRLSSLPFFFGTNLETLPAAPYLRARVGTPPLSRIGLVWAGNARFRNDASRSLQFDQMKPLLACGAEHFVSLQKDYPDEERKILYSGLFDAAPLLENFADTAALIAKLDLVITVDTATAHLAGALGKPVWILLPFDSDWRWLLGREDSPWYPMARLFRQRKPGDWAPVIEAVAGEVRKWLAGDASVLQPPVWTGENLRQNPDAVSLTGS